MSDINKILVAGGASVLSLAAVYFALNRAQKNEVKDSFKQKPDTIIALLGDIGGTNVRLTLKRLNLKTRTSDTILDLKKYNSQHVNSLQETIENFLKQIPVSLNLLIDTSVGSRT